MPKQQPSQPGIMQLGSAILSDAYNSSAGLIFETIMVRMVQAETITTMQEVLQNVVTRTTNTQNITAML